LALRRLRQPGLSACGRRVPAKLRSGVPAPCTKTLSFRTPGPRLGNRRCRPLPTFRLRRLRRVLAPRALMTSLVLATVRGQDRGRQRGRVLADLRFCDRRSLSPVGNQPCHPCHHSHQDDDTTSPITSSSTATIGICSYTDQEASCCLSARYGRTELVSGRGRTATRSVGRRSGVPRALRSSPKTPFCEPEPGSSAPRSQRSLPSEGRFNVTRNESFRK
jgi:hypothetical protein